MNEKDTDQYYENFSDDPIANLRLENDILKLKMQAQFGAITQISPGLPPDIENEFLQNIQRFDDAWQNVKLIKVYDLAGKPVFKKAESLSSEKIGIELERLEKLLAEKNIYLHVHGEYEPSVIYRFITEELFEYETEDMQVEGFQNNFIYEEFYPNHKLDLVETTVGFFRSWFTKNFDEHSLELSQVLMNADSTQLTHAEMVSKLTETLANFTSFSNEKYKMLETSYEWNESNGRGMGFTEGVITYDAECESGESVNINGPFKLYFCNQHGYWNIFYFIFPGFEW